MPGPVAALPPDEWIARERRALEAALDRALPGASEPPTRLHEAMRYSVLGGGKRLRPLLCRAAAEAVAGAPVAAALGPACAVEMIHCYSLIHDDLPALDNDDVRRGRPTCHKAYGEATAILAGDALLTLAFGQLADQTPARLPGMLAELTAAAGTPRGMVAGQAEDLEAERAPVAGAEAEAAVRRIHRCKTGALIRAAVALGALAAEAAPDALARLAAFGEDIGLAFQIVDDLLDITASSARLGKSAGKDRAQSKLTWPAVFGQAASEAEARRLGAQALARLGPLPGAAMLAEMARRLIERDW